VRLIEFLEGELPPAAAARLQAHLKVCAECAPELARLRASREAIERLPLQEPSAAFWQALRAAIGERLDAGARRARHWRLWPVAALPLAAAAAFLLIWWASPPVQRPTPSLSVATLLNDPSLDAWLLEAPLREANRYGWAAPFLLRVGEREFQELVQVAEAREAGVLQRVDQVAALTDRELEQLVAALEKGAAR
jgi:hypothetical protein